MTRFNRADVWVLLGPHRGDNNQLLALAESLGIPFRPIELRYRWFAHLPAVARSITVSQLQPDARQAIAPPWPSLVLGIGQRSAPVARYIQRESGGRAKIVRLGDPMVSHRLFDLVITTTQYAVRDADNVVRLPITITDQDEVRPNQLEERWLQRFARPRRLVVIGGKTSLWRFDTNVVSAATQSLRRRAGLEGGSVIAVTSPRTSPELVAAAQGALGEEAVVTDSFPRYGALLAAADEIHVTGDSVSMLSDAIASGKPVGLIPLEPDLIARLVRLPNAIMGRPFRMRDLDKFWDDLRARGLVGTVDDPRSGTLDFSPIDTAIAAIRAVVDDRSPDLVQPVRIPAGRATVPAAEAMTL
jgi:mitochondrial fission protein ELM1